MSILDGHTAYDPASMPNAIGTGAIGTNAASAETTKPANGPTKKDVKDLLASFAPAAPVTESPVEKERKKRIKSWNDAVRQLVGVFELLGGADSEPYWAAKTLKDLTVVLKSGTKAMDALKDGQLVPAEPKAPRAPKAAKIEEPTPPAEAETVTDSSFAGEQQAPSGDDSNTGF